MSSTEELSCDELKKLNVSGDRLSPLESMLNELTWKIFEYVPDQVADLRLTSKTLRDRVNEYALLRGNITLVEELKMNSGNIVGQDSFFISIYVPTHKSSLFELRLKLRNYSVHFEITSFPPIKFSSIWLKKYSVDLTENDGSKLAILGDCLGRRVVKVFLFNCLFPGSLAAASTLIEGMKIDKLSILIGDLSDAIANHLKAAVTANKVDQVSIALSTNSTSSKEALLIELSSLVHSMHIDQLDSSHPDHCYNLDSFYFGLYKIDWAPIIVEMFSRKLNKLWLDNRENPTRNLARPSLKVLKEHLTSLNKNVWFYAKWDDDSVVGVDFETSNAHILKGHCIDIDGEHEPSRLGPYFLSIIHSSRVDEKF